MAVIQFPSRLNNKFVSNMLEIYADLDKLKREENIDKALCVNALYLFGGIKMFDEEKIHAYVSVTSFKEH